jgi:7,8-dihydropterin-6-yl-methyl-4-(beta-D-ribofuranosyl)aminobenzene 5'-phosphate synthase
MDIPIYVHPDAFLDRYSQNKRYIGIDKDIKEFLKNYKYLKLINEPYFEDNLIISGEIERNSPNEPEIFYKLVNNNGNGDNDSNNNFEIDSVNDDMFIIVDDVVITGCSHSGIINVIEYAKKINKNKIRGVIGGFHLVVSSNDYIQSVYEYLNNSDLEFVMPLHCTGFNAMKVLSDLDNFIYGHVGKVIEL